MATQITQGNFHPGAIPEVNESQFVKRLFDSGRERETAFRELILKTHGHLYKYVMNYISDSLRAEKMVQRIYKNAFKYLHSYSCDIKLTTWLYMVANSILFDTLSDSAWVPGSKMIDNQIDKVFGTASNSRESQLKSLLPKLIDALPTTLKEVYFIKDVGGVSLDETASILGISYEAARTRLDWARHHIVQQLQKKLAVA